MHELVVLMRVVRELGRLVVAYGRVTECVCGAVKPIAEHGEGAPG